MTNTDLSRSSPVLGRLRAVRFAVKAIAGGHDELLQGGAQLLLATGAVHGLNYLYHVLMSRALGPTDYGALVVLLSLVLLLTVPMNTIQTTVALKTAGCGRDQLGILATTLLGEVRRRWLILALIAWLVLCLASPLLAAVLRLRGTTPIIAAGALLPLAAFLPVIRGLLQGTHSFGMLGVNLLIESGGKVVIGVALVGLGLGLIGAMGGVVLGALASLAWGLSLLPREVAPKRGDPMTVSPLLRAAAPVGATLLLFTILTNADVIVAKASMLPRQAGYYAAANTAGKILIYATWPVWAVLFPALGRDGRPSRVTRQRLGIGIGLTLLIGAPILAFYGFNPHLAITILFGPQYVDASRLLLPLGLAMMAYQVAFLSMSHELAVGRLRYLGVAVVSVILLTGLLILASRTLAGLAFATLSVGAAIAAVTTCLTFL